MRVRIPDLGEEPRGLDFTEAVPDGPGVSDQRFERRLEVRAEIYRLGQDVHLSGHIAGRVLSNCPRCLDEFTSQLDRDFRFLLMPREARAYDEAGEGVDCYSGDELDLSPLVREQAVLALDDSVLCSGACKGLCQECGANLNHETCSCNRREA